MNKRSFIKSLLISCVAPSIFIPKEPVKWKRENNLLVPNPNWVDAEYEVAFVHNYESRALSFIPSFRDFLEAQINLKQISYLS